MRLKRFTLGQRIFHLLLIISFLLQAATGMARMYIEIPWGKELAAVFGGYESALAVHKFVGVFMIMLFVIHLLYLIIKINWERFPSSLTGRDSIVPGFRDVKNFIQHLGWMIGVSKEPRFGRWGYWEKFDYWAVFWGMVIIGGTGIILYNPVASSRIMPGWGLNIALWVHRIEAILAILHVFIIHFFVAHLRRHNFPMDRAMFEGSVDLDKARSERPAWVEDMQNSGELEKNMTPAAGGAAKAVTYVVGFTAMAVGIYLLVFSILNVPYITW